MVIYINKDAKRAGFTIVELLVVIVVIAVLAAITVVAYNQVQDRAREAVAKDAASQAYRKLATYFVDNGSYPTNLQTLGINTNDGQATYQYNYDNSVNPSAFCITITTNGDEFYIDNTNTTTPTSGNCDEHDWGGVTIVTNLVTNPGLEGNTPTGWTLPNGTTAVASTLQAHTGTHSIKLTLPANIASSNVGAGPFRDTAVPNILQANSVYTMSAWVYVPSGSVPMRVSVQGAGMAIRNTTSTTSTGSTINQWIQLRDVITTSASGSLTFYILNASVTPSTTSLVYIDDAMVVAGDHSCTYADPTSNAQWSWTGSANNSSSTGPCL